MLGKFWFLQLIVFSTAATPFLSLGYTTFEVPITFRCTARGFWCYYARLVEVDRIHRDYISHWGTQCNDRERNSITLRGWDQGDGLFNNFYELRLSVQHSCSDFSKRRVLNIDLDPISVRETNVTIDIGELLLDHRGYLTSNGWGEH